MTPVQIFWDPIGITVDSIGRKDYLDTKDGDTPIASTSIRMLSIDTPETHYPGNTKPSKHDNDLVKLAEWINQGKAPINNDLGSYLIPKLNTGTAGTLQEEQGNDATDALKNLLNNKLSLPSGKKRDLFIRAADQHFDQWGRLLAYIAPYYASNELATLTRKQRATFNLLMVESGWAASLPIYPNIPSYPDLILLREVAKEAFDNKKGIWAKQETLTGYEFRMCVKLFKVTKKLVNGDKLSRAEKYGWIERYCVDMTTREIFYPQDYVRVKPYDRIFVWPKDVVDAVGKMNLLAPK